MGQKAKEAVTFRCEDCGAGCVAGWDSDGDEYVAHNEPTCATFDRLDALDFVTFCRKRAEARLHGHRGPADA